MIMHLGFQGLPPRYRYEKLLRDVDYDDKAALVKAPSTRRRCFWVKKMNGRLIKGLKMSRSRRLNWKGFSWLVFPKKIARIYSEVVKRLIDLDGSNIIFSTTWGLPVLSHSPSVSCRKSSIVSLDRRLGFV